MRKAAFDLAPDGGRADNIDDDDFQIDLQRNEGERLDRNETSRAASTALFSAASLVEVYARSEELTKEFTVALYKYLKDDNNFSARRQLTRHIPRFLLLGGTIIGLCLLTFGVPLGEPYVGLYDDKESAKAWTFTLVSVPLVSTIIWVTLTNIVIQLVGEPLTWLRQAFIVFVASIGPPLVYLVFGLAFDVLPLPWSPLMAGQPTNLMFPFLVCE